MKLVWHYTTGQCSQRIVAAGRASLSGEADRRDTRTVLCRRTTRPWRAVGGLVFQKPMVGAYG